MAKPNVVRRALVSAPVGAPVMVEATHPETSKVVMVPVETAKMYDQIASLRAENAKLAKQKARVTMKVSEKGALSVFGFGQWPVTHYWDQWERLFTLQDEMRAFYMANKTEIDRRSEATRAAKAEERAKKG